MDAPDLAFMDEMARREDAKHRADGRAKLKADKEDRKKEVEKKADETRKEMVRRGAEEAPDQSFFTNEKGTYVPHKFANWVLDDSDQHYICIDDNDEVLYYDRGVYKPRGDMVIEQCLVKIMNGVGINPNNANATVFSVRRRSGTPRDNIDSDENVINLLNGLYNIATDEIVPHSHKHLSVKQMNVVYDADATCPRIDKFLHEIMSDEDVEFVYELFGYTLMPIKRESTAVFFEGSGANGKSVLMDLMKHFVGSDAMADVTPNEMGGEDKYALADLFGKSLNVVDDLGNDIVEGVGAFKSVITGQSIRAQHKYGHAFTFEPHVLCVFGCNEVPQTLDTSDGYYRRMRIINFPTLFEGANENKNLIDELRESGEISGLFNAGITAMKNVIVRGGFTGNMSVAEKRRAYNTKSDPTLQFLEEEFDTSDPNAMEGKNDVFNAYVLWCGNKNIRVRPKGSMTTSFQAVGVAPGRLPRNDEGYREPCYVGIKFRAGLGSGSGLEQYGNDDGRLSGSGGTGVPPYCKRIDKSIGKDGSDPHPTPTTSQKPVTSNCNMETPTRPITQPTTPPNQQSTTSLPSEPDDFDTNTADRIRDAIDELVLKPHNFEGCCIADISMALNGIPESAIHRHLTTFVNKLNVDVVKKGDVRLYKMRERVKH